MEDAVDPFFQQYTLRLAKALVRRYAGYPALLTFGIDNEPGIAILDIFAHMLMAIATASVVHAAITGSMTLFPR